MKIVRRVLSGLLILIIFLLALFKVVDRSDPAKKPHQRVMQQRLDSLKLVQHAPPGQQWQSGYAVVSLTPSTKTSTAGYFVRRGRKFEEISDSCFVRAVVVTNGNNKVAIVSADLLLIPPEVTKKLAETLPAIGYSLENTFLTATHTHNGVGNWARGVGNVLYGGYDPEMVQWIAEQIVSAVSIADKSIQGARILYGQVGAGSLVRNRLDKTSGIVDSLIRYIQIDRVDGTRAMIISFTAHPTCTSSRDLDLSADYPGTLVREMEESGYDFAMFMAGAMGSHGVQAPAKGDACVEWVAEKMAEKLADPPLRANEDLTLFYWRVPLALPESQLRVSKYVALRSWLFAWAFGEYPVYLTCLRIGDIVLLGTPCDFSGELSGPLDAAAERLHLFPMVTGFNGGYIGYITNDKYYDRDHYETRLMNWYGPGNGAYVQSSLKEMIVAAAD